MDQLNSLLALSTIRKNRGISLQEIAEATKISVRSLEAIEHEQFQKLPGGIYNTSYIRQYARAIDYDEAVILAVYYQRTSANESDPNRAIGHDKGVLGGGYRPASSAI